MAQLVEPVEEQTQLSIHADHLRLLLSVLELAQRLRQDRRLQGQLYLEDAPTDHRGRPIHEHFEPRPWSGAIRISLRQHRQWERVYLQQDEERGSRGAPVLSLQPRALAELPPSLHGTPGIAQRPVEAPGASLVGSPSAATQQRSLGRQEVSKPFSYLPEAVLLSGAPRHILPTAAEQQSGPPPL